MNKFKVLLIDVDGVLLKMTNLFSHAYAEEMGLDKERFDKWFEKYGDDAVLGKTDFLDLIIQHNDVWEWPDEPVKLMEKWFDHENSPDEELVKIVEKARENGILVFLATDQDKQRAKYLKEVLFLNLIDGAFVSSDLKINKIKPVFFQKVIATLSEQIPGIKPNEIIFFDDTQHNIDSALSIGLDAHLYRDPAQVEEYLTS